MQGKCAICGNYKCCEPKNDCTAHEQHKRWLALIRKSEEITDLDSTPVIINDSCYQTNVDENIIESNKAQQRLFNIKDINNLLHTIPKNGFKTESLASKGRTYRRAQLLHLKTLTLVNKLLIPEEPSLCCTFSVKEEDSEKMFDNACDLYLRGDNTTSAVSAAIMASSFRQEYLHRNIQQRVNEMPVSLYSKLNGNRHGFGLRKYRYSHYVFKN